MARAGRHDAPVEKGLVVAAYGRRYRVELAGGREIDCVTRGRKSNVACGDRVCTAATSSGEGVIEGVEPRKTLFYRSDARRQKLLAANVTQIIVVVAAQPAWSDDLVSRCLVGAEHAGIAALIALNKADLPEAPAASSMLDLYRSLSYEVVTLSAKLDLAPLVQQLNGHLTVLVGQSGMGKSTIINGLVPHASARVAEISTALGTGKHTTTHAELYHVKEAADIIDSPGLQEFGLNHLSAQDAAHAFVEFREYLGHCRFRDCLHMQEPGCGIKDAAERGKLSERRFASYKRLAAELTRKTDWK